MSPVNTPLPDYHLVVTSMCHMLGIAIDEFHWRQGPIVLFNAMRLDLVLFLNSAPGSTSKLKERGQIPSATVGITSDELTEVRCGV